MALMPSPILIFGDIFLSKNNIIAAKKKYSDLKWVTMSATDDSLDSIRMESGGSLWDDSGKILLVEDLPNRKQVREFLIDLASTLSQNTRLIVWDSNNCIKVNPKTKTFDKTWGEFVGLFRNIPGSKVVNNGEKLTEKEEGDCVEFIKNRFAKLNKKIETREAKLLINIVGYSRGMLDSDIDKMALTSLDKVTSSFILENAFPSSKEAVLYKIANILDTASYEDSINLISRFLEVGINVNVIAEIIVKKARWQMVAAYFLDRGLKSNEVVNRLVNMGKFPSYVWHNPNLDTQTKQAETEQFQSEDGILKYLTENYGYSPRYFRMVKEIKSKPNKSKKAEVKIATKMKKKSPEIIPYPFMATQIVDFVVNKICGGNDVKTEGDIKRVLDRAIKVYLFSQEKLASVRYGENPIQDIQEMIRTITDVSLSSV